MARHVPTRDRDSPMNNAGDLSSHRPHTREYNFTFNGEASVPRSLAPLYISPTGTRISHVLQDHQKPNSISRTCHNEDYGSNYTFGTGTPSGDTGAALARAIQALTLGAAEDKASTDRDGELAHEHNLLEQVSSENNSRGQYAFQDHAHGSGIHVVATTQRQFSGIQDQPNIPRATTGLHPKRGEDIDLDNISDALGNSEDDHNTQHRDKEATRLDPVVQKSVSFKEQSLDGGALDNKTDRESYFLGLGSWHSTDPEAPAEISRSFAEASSPSGIDPAFRSYDNFKPGFTQCGAEGSGSTSSGGQGRQSLSAGSNASWNNQGQFSSGVWKGKRPSGAGGDEDGDDEQGNKRIRGDETPPETPSQKFSCPFQKHDPADVCYYGTKGRHRSCTGGFPTIARLKEHLYRCHLNKFACARCQQTFPDQERVDNHHREENRCVKRPKTTSGITSAVEMQLRKKTVAQNPESKWYEIYRLIFPSASLPKSPYYGHDSSEDFKKYAERHLPEALDMSLDPFLRDWPCTQEQRAILKDAVAKFCRTFWDGFNNIKEADKATPSDSSETVAELLDFPETPPNLPNQGSIHWPVDDSRCHQSNQPLVTAYSKPTLSSPFSPGYPPLPPREGPIPVHDRPCTPQRGTSYWSDSALGSCCNCDQCSNGKYGQCLAPVSPPNGNISTSLQMAGHMPDVSNAFSQFDNIYDPNLDPSFSTSQNFEEMLGPHFQNYCGQHPGLQNPRQGPQ
ncbi:hypothetical protein DL98DRAFT_654250 [Cadophora sp. DSE1049]|nr:hypothetical protein DL98DRAFT_654250 [Cadophora sp. DSE1049]